MNVCFYCCFFFFCLDRIQVIARQVLYHRAIPTIPMSSLLDGIINLLKSDILFMELSFILCFCYVSLLSFLFDFVIWFMLMEEFCTLSDPPLSHLRRWHSCPTKTPCLWFYPQLNDFIILDTSKQPSTLPTLHFWRFSPSYTAISLWTGNRGCYFYIPSVSLSLWHLLKC